MMIANERRGRIFTSYSGELRTTISCTSVKMAIRLTKMINIQ